MSKFLQTTGFKWKDSKNIDLNKYINNSWTCCVLETDLENPEELRELHEG